MDDRRSDVLAAIFWTVALAAGALYGWLGHPRTAECFFGAGLTFICGMLAGLRWGALARG